MPKTVFTAGNPITSRLKLGITPDGTTTPAVAVYRPDGTTITGYAVGSWSGTAGDEIVAQWYATDDGTPGASTTASVGDWLAVWTVTGTGASVTPKVYNVVPVPGTDTRADWTPFLSEVADYVPWLTLDTTIPGGDTFLGTFTGNTYPGDEQVARHLKRVADPIAARWPDLPSTLTDLARTYVALRTAANLARAYPRTPGELAEADSLAVQADSAWADLSTLANDATASPTGTGAGPVYAFPEPAVHGDMYL